MIPRPSGLAEPGTGRLDEAASGRRKRADIVALSRPLQAKRGTSVVPGVSMLPALRRAELILARQDRPVGSRPVRVPLDAFVPIASRLLPPPPGSRLMLDGPAVTPGANDNASPALPPRSVLREVVFLLILAATLAGTYYIGRMSAVENVIVVPGPSSYRSVVT